MLLPTQFVVVGTIINAIGSIAYIIDVVKGKVKPNRVSFVLWSIAPFIAFAAQIKDGIAPEALLTFTTGFTPLVILLASFTNKKAEWKITRFDLVCGALSLLGLVLWLTTSIGTLAIIFSIMADALAAVPTLIKAFKYPETEATWPWVAGSVGMLLTILTIDRLTLTNSGFIIYVMVLNMIIFSLVYFKIGKRLGFSAKR